MDNPENKKGITIKINGKEKPFVEKESHVDGKVAKNQASAAAEQEEERFDWVLPKDEGVFYQPASTTKKKSPTILTFGGKRKNPRNRSGFVLKAWLLAGLFAVIVGSSLGLAVLKTITADKEVAAVPVAAMKPDTGNTGADDKNEAATSDNQPLTVYFVQGGVFSNEDAAKQIQVQAAAKGVPAEVLKQGEKFYLFLGIATSLEESKQLGTFLKSYDVEVFWKEFSLKPGSKTSSHIALMNKMVAVFQNLTKTSAAQLLNPKATADMKALNSEIKALKAEVKGDIPAELSAAYADLSSAADLINQYQSKKETSQLLQAQQKLLNFLNSYQN